MSWEQRSTDPEMDRTEAASLDPEETQPESGRKGGAVIAARPAYMPAVTTRDWLGTPAVSAAGARANWGAALLAGVAGGGLLLGAEMLLAPILHDTTMWAPVRLMASVVVGEQAMVPPLTFDPGMTLAGLLVHFLACTAFALAFAPMLRWFERGPAALMGAAYGLLTYNLVFYAAALVQPTLIYGRGLPSILGHLLFGVALAALYRTFAGAPEAPIADPPPAEIQRSETAIYG